MTLRGQMNDDQTLQEKMQLVSEVASKFKVSFTKETCIGAALLLQEVKTNEALLELLYQGKVEIHFKHGNCTLEDMVIQEAKQ